MDFARTMLEDSGDFYPFGASITADGKLVAVGGNNGEERPNPQEIYKLLGGAFTSGAQNGELFAAALAANVDVPPQYSSPSPDALRVHLESDGYSRFIYVPYRLQKRGLFKNKRVAEFSEPFAVEVGPTFFVPKGNG